MRGIEYVNAITSHLVRAGDPGLLRRRTWGQRLFSWPWRPWIDMEFVPGWTERIRARNDERVEEREGRFHTPPNL